MSGILKGDDFEKNMWVTFHSHKPRTMPMLNPTDGNMIQVEVPTGRNGIGFPYLIRSVQLPFIVLASFNVNQLLIIPADTRESNFMKVDKSYAVAMLGYHGIDAVMNDGKRKKRIDRNLPFVPIKEVFKNGTLSYDGGNLPQKKESIMDNDGHILDGLRDPNNVSSADWTAKVDYPNDNLPPGLFGEADETH